MLFYRNFKKYIFCLSVGLLVSLSNPCVAEEEGIDLFISACQYQGANPTLIHSGYADFELDVFTEPRSPKEIEEQSKKRIVEIDKAKINPKFRESAIESVKNEIEGQAHKKLIFSILFSGNEWETGKRRIETSTFEHALKKWDSTSTFLSGQYQNTTTSVLGISGVQQVNILDKPLSLTEFHFFGRMRGIPSRYASIAMLNGTDINKFKFTSNGIKRFKDSVANVSKNTTNASVFKIESSVTYDIQATAKQLISSVAGKKTQEYWIDSTRGYICPRLIFYENGKIKEEYVASNFFLHEKTGLWFPENYEEIEYHSVSGNIIREFLNKSINTSFDNIY
ncbi:MAG: hypothetical protein LBJ67_08535 [Planctomycetaceae bacterium]|jgi:hypothetical protein|nr:hypothetical protein [Planctomycetaceae bacterium]